MRRLPDLNLTVRPLEAADLEVRGALRGAVQPTLPARFERTAAATDEVAAASDHRLVGY